MSPSPLTDCSALARLITHDVINATGAATLSLSSVLRRLPNDEHAPALRRALRSVLRAQRMVGMLPLLQPPETMPPASSERLELVPLLQKMCNQLRVGDPQLAIETRFEGQPRVFGDERELEDGLGILGHGFIALLAPASRALIEVQCSDGTAIVRFHAQPSANDSASETPTLVQWCDLERMLFERVMLRSRARLLPRRGGTAERVVLEFRDAH